MVNINDIVEYTNLPYKLFKRGKVRDVYELSNNELLIVSTDRISAFDVVLQNPIPQKGIFLNKISMYFLKLINEKLGIKVHLGHGKLNDNIPDNIVQRSTVAKKTDTIKVECIIRGYLVGSLYNEYREKKTINGVQVNREYKFAEPLPQILFTPTTKEEVGHDTPITIQDIEKMYGATTSKFIVENSIKIYKFAKEFLLSKNLILVDTKLEWGILNNDIILIDEVLTPDSSRYWLKEDLDNGKVSDFYDKQLVRDYLINIKWDKKLPAPKLPSEIISETARRYELIHNRITKQKLTNYSQ